MTSENYSAPDAAAVVAWAKERPRRAANIAFTSGPERQAAYWIEWAEAVERERWCAAVVYAAHQLESARIWSGTEWRYNPLHYGAALERLRDAMRGNV